MDRNSFNQQLLTSLNPDSLFQTHFASSNPQKFRRLPSRNSVSGKSTVKSADKRQYLSLVSKEKKPQKRTLLKSSKKNGPKKIHSVILGGQKSSNISLTQTQKSLRSSLCRSCISLNKKTPIMTQTTLRHHAVNVEPYIQPFQIFVRPQTSILDQKPKIQQLNKIIQQKLILQNPPQYQETVKKTFTAGALNFNPAPGKFADKFIRNTASTGRIYFSGGKSFDKPRQNTQQKEKPISTPRFDDPSPEKGQKCRKNAGFIRSSSAPKISYDSCPQSFRQEVVSTYQPSSNHVQITKCIQKMSSIRKEIDELQDFLKDRLLTSELKNKFLYKSPSTCLKDKQIPSNQMSFSTININSRLNESDNIRYTPINSIVLEKNPDNCSKSALMQIKSSSLNTNQFSSRSNNFVSESSKMFQSCQKIQNLYEMKLPLSNYNSNLEKRIMNEISSRNLNFQKDNQQNIFYHKNPFNSVR